MANELRGQRIAILATDGVERLELALLLEDDAKQPVGIIRNARTL